MRGKRWVVVALLFMVEERIARGERRRRKSDRKRPEKREGGE